MSQSESCSSEYATPTGQPCVPGGGDLDCADLPQWGIGGVVVVGQDVYGFDPDGDGTACETSVPAEATGFGEFADEVAPVGIALAALALVAFSVLPVRWALRLYRQAGSEAETRALKFSVALTIVAAIPLVLIGGFLFSAVGIE